MLLVEKMVMSGGGPSDPNFKNVTLLLHGDGTNGGQNNTFIDGSSNNFTITRNGNPTQGSFNPYGSLWSNYFDGTDDYLSIADNSALRPGAGAFTIEAWIYRNVAGADHTIFAKGGASTGVVFQVTSGNVLRFTHTTTNIDSTGTIAANAWTHVAVVREGTGSNQTKLYINGVNDGQGTVSTDFTQTEEARIGTNRSAGADFSGYISNLRLVKGTAVYTANFTPPASNLTAISNTSLLTCQSNRFRDNSANDFAVTRNNNAKVSSFSPFTPGSAYTTGMGASGDFNSDGSGDFLSIADAADLDLSGGDYTIELWAYGFFPPAAPGQGSIFFSKRSGTSTPVAWQLGYSPTSPYYIGWFTGTSYDSTTELPLFQWNHLAAIYTGGNINLYLNGVNILQTAVANNEVNASVTIGAIATAAGPFKGYMSGFRIIKGQALSTGNFTPPTYPVSGSAVGWTGANVAASITGTVSLLMNFTNGAIFDSTAKNDLETGGNAQIDTGTKKFGTGSLEFDGNGDYLRTTSNLDLYTFGTGDFTIELWIYFNTVATTQTFFDMRPPSTSGMYPSLGLVSGTIQFAPNDVTRITSGSLSATTWYHFALARSGTSTKMFIDGTQAGSTYTDSSDYLCGALMIGGNAWWFPNTNFSSNCFIDDVRITKGVARYTANFTPPTRPFPDK